MPKYTIFTQILNDLDFFLRKNIKFSRKGLKINNEDKNKLFSDGNLIVKEDEYSNEYNLKKIKNNSTKRNYLETLYTIEILEKAFNLNSHLEKAKILDIGSKNWFYAQGEYSYFSKWHKSLELTGVELDGYRVYSDFYSRKDYAEYYIKNLQNTKYIIDNLLNIDGEYDYITWFLPFVAEAPLINWGLPLREFQPELLLKKAYSLLKQNGKMLIVNQGINEFEIQKDLLNRLSIPYDEIGKIESAFLEYQHDRFAVIVKK